MVFSILIPHKLEEKKAFIYNTSGERVSEIALPTIFSIPVRKDLIRRAFLSAFTAMLQPKGRDPLAGRRTTARCWGVGYGVSRVPRLRTGRAMFVSFARSGHLAFPPRPDRVVYEEINKKERVYAILSALSATSNTQLVRQRGHVFETDPLPIIVLDEVEDSVSKAREARVLFEKIGIWSDIVRSYERVRIRAGKGKMRGRKYTEPRSVLFILSSYSKPFAKAVRNFPGVDIATPFNLSILHLAPGGVPGRLTVFSKSAFEEVSKKYKVVSL